MKSLIQHWNRLHESLETHPERRAHLAGYSFCRVVPVFYAQIHDCLGIRLLPFPVGTVDRLKLHIIEATYSQHLIRKGRRRLTTPTSNVVMKCLAQCEAQKKTIIQEWIALTKHGILFAIYSDKDVQYTDRFSKLAFSGRVMAMDSGNLHLRRSSLLAQEEHQFSPSFGLRPPLSAPRTSRREMYTAQPLRCSKR
eukprot:1161683-Pelagomonas_calceolata.AAC.1